MILMIKRDENMECVRFSNEIVCSLYKKASLLKEIIEREKTAVLCATMI